MASALGLDLSKNLSLLTVPGAFAITILPHVYSLSTAFKLYDIVSPRNFRDNIQNSQKLSKAAKGRIIRAKNASDNGFETLGFFAAAVLAGNQAGLSTFSLNSLTLTYLASRILYTIWYIWFNESFAAGTVRTGLWQAGIAATIALWVKAGVATAQNYPF